MIYVGGIIVILTIVAMIKRYEVRLVLFVSGLLMCSVALKPLEAVKAFTTNMVHGSLVPIICTVMGFAYVLKLTECDSHLVHALTKPLTKVKMILIPGAAMITFVINIALPSAAGVSAAVGAILIPALIATGVNPAMAATAVMAGTFGSCLSPGSPHIVTVADLAKVGVMDVVFANTLRTVICGLIGAISLTIYAVVRKEMTGYVPANPADAVMSSNASNFKVNPIKAIVPVVPFALLILTSSALKLFKTEVTVPQAMFVGIFLAALVALKNPQEVSRAFFSGMGSAYAEVIGIIVAAGVFTAGMSTIGLTGALIKAMQGSDTVVRIAASMGPMFIAVLSGSGDAATLAFNQAITPHAAAFGLDTISLGTTAHLAGALGRTMSPVAGAAIICAGLAKVNPMEIAKRNAIGMIIAVIVCILMMS